MPNRCAHHLLLRPSVSRHWIASATRSPSCQPTSRPRPHASSTSSASSTRAAAGTPASAPAPRWLSWRVGLDLRAARGTVRVARALGTLPRLAQALARGELSYAKVRALTRVATPETGSAVAGRRSRRHGLPRRADRPRLATDGPQGRGAGERATAREPRAPRLSRRGRHRGAPRAAVRPRSARCSCRRWPRLARRCIRKWAFRPRNRPRWPSSRRTRWPCSQRRLSTTASTPAPRASDTRSWSTSTPPALADPDQPGQSVLEDGAHVSAETSRRLACDASRVVMQHDGTAASLRSRPAPARFPRPYGARSTTGTAAAASRAAKFAFGQGHHIRHWAQGGPTTLSNLALLCRRHHRAVHEEGYQLDREPDGELRFRRPDGQASARGPASSQGARRSREDPARAERGGGTRPERADHDPGLAGRAPERGLGNRRLAPPREVAVMARKAKPAAGKRVESLRREGTLRRI